MFWIPIAVLTGTGVWLGHHVFKLTQRVSTLENKKPQHR